MYYRYIAQERSGSGWKGLCQVLTPDCRRKIGQFISEPKWYRTHPDIDSECWFTEQGYNKYHKKIEEIIDHYKENWGELKVRLLKATQLDNIVMVGKIQIIRLKENKK